MSLGLMTAQGLLLWIHQPSIPNNHPLSPGNPHPCFPPPSLFPLYRRAWLLHCHIIHGFSKQTLLKRPPRMFLSMIVFGRNLARDGRSYGSLTKRHFDCNEPQSRRCAGTRKDQAEGREVAPTTDPFPAT